MKTQKLTRRQFLIASAVSVTAVAGGAVGMAKMAQTGAGENPDTYYISHKDSILATFDGTLTYIRPVLAKKYGAEFADAVLAETRTEYAALIPQLPYIGGDANELTTNLSQSAGVLAFYRVMKVHGKSVDEVGEIIYQGFDAQMADTPGWVTGVMGLLQSAGLAAYAAKKDADISQQQTYPGDCSSPTSRATARASIGALITPSAVFASSSTLRTPTNSPPIYASLTSP